MAAFVLESFAGANSTLHELWRPLLVSEVLVMIVFAAIWLLSRNRHWAALLSSVGLGFFAGYIVPALILAMVLVWFGAVAAIRRVRKRRTLAVSDIPTRFANAFSFALLSIATFSAATAVWPRVGPRPQLAVSSEARAGPDIFVLLLDGYPRADTLSSDFGIDNSGFTAELAARDFDVASQSSANYNKTWLTVASLLDGRYVHDLPVLADPPKDAPDQIRLLHEVIEGGSVLDVLRKRSYELVTVPSAVTTSDPLSGTIRETGHLNAFEVQLIAHSLIGRVLPGVALTLLADDHRANVKDGLALMGRIASENTDHPRLVFTHVIAPHLPFVFGQDADYLGRCFPRCDLWTTPLEQLDLSESEYASRLRIQLKEVNATVMRTLDDVISADPDAFIIVMSDHGIRHHISDPEEHFRSFFAARTPGYEQVFPDDVSPVNVFRRIFSVLWDDHLDDLPYEAWLSDWERPLVLERFP